MTLTLVPFPLRDLAEREHRIKIFAQLTQRSYFRDIALSKWRMARNSNMPESIIEALGHWVSAFSD